MSWFQEYQWYIWKNQRSRILKSLGQVFPRYEIMYNTEVLNFWAQNALNNFITSVFFLPSYMRISLIFYFLLLFVVIALFCPNFGFWETSFQLERRGQFRTVYPRVNQRNAVCPKVVAWTSGFWLVENQKRVNVGHFVPG